MAWACARHSLPEHPLASTEGPGSWAGPSPRPLQAGAAWSTATQEPTFSPAPLFRAPEGDAPSLTLPPGSQRNEGWGHHSRWLTGLHGFLSTSPKWKKSWLVRAGQDG